MILNIKNNGGFDVSGVIVKISNDAANEPTIALPSAGAGAGGAAGTYIFDLQPGISLPATFTNSSSGPIKRVSYQPFVFINNKKVI